MILSIKLRADKDSSAKEDVLALLSPHFHVESVKWEDEITAGVTTASTTNVARENIGQASRWRD